MPRSSTRHVSFLIALAMMLVSVAINGCQSHQASAPASSEVLAATSAKPSRLAPDQAMAKLQEGNGRFVNGKMSYPNQDAARRSAVVASQRPFAVILACSDSRVPPEVVFDCGLGDVFVIRVAGNVLSDSALASIEYGTAHLGAPLVVVLGHDKCGAAQAAIDVEQNNVQPEGHLNAITHMITPVVKEATTQPGNLLDNVIDDNVQRVVEKLKKSEPIMSGLVFSGKVQIIGARYNLDTGAVKFFPDPPQESQHN